MAADVADVLDRAAAVLAELHAVDLDGVDDDSLSDAVLAMQRLRGRLDVGEARVLSRWDAQGAWRASGAKTGAAWLAWKQRVPDPGGTPAPPPRAGDAHPARHRGGVGGGRHRSSPRHHAPRRSHRPHGPGLRRRSRAAARPRPHPRVRGLQARLRPLGDDRRPRRRRAGRRRRPGGSRGAPVPELRRDVVRSRHARPGVG